MDLNFLFFPKIKSSYTHDSLDGNLVYVPKLKKIYDQFEQGTSNLPIPSQPHGPQYFINKYQKSIVHNACKDKQFQQDNYYLEQMYQNLQTEIELKAKSYQFQVKSIQDVKKITNLTSLPVKNTTAYHISQNKENLSNYTTAKKSARQSFTYNHKYQQQFYSEQKQSSYPFASKPLQQKQNPNNTFQSELQNSSNTNTVQKNNNNRMDINSLHDLQYLNFDQPLSNRLQSSLETSNNITINTYNNNNQNQDKNGLIRFDTNTPFSTTIDDQEFDQEQEQDQESCDLQDMESQEEDIMGLNSVQQRNGDLFDSVLLNAETNPQVFSEANSIHDIFQNQDNNNEENQFQLQYDSTNSTQKNSFQASKRESLIQPMDHLSIQSSDKNKVNQFQYEIVGHIPCLYLPYGHSKQIILYFHANGEDIGQSKDMILDIQQGLKVNILCMEYPNYGIYKDSQCNTEKILRDAEIVYEFVLKVFNFEEKSIFVMGRSIGSGPATHVAARYRPGALVLISPLTSIKAVVKDLGGWVSQFLIKERLNNLELISKVKCPSLFIHGLKDNLISHNHSQKLYDAHKGKKQIRLSPKMTHNELSFMEDVIRPVLAFLRDNRLLINYYKNTKFAPTKQIPNLMVRNTPEQKQKESKELNIDKQYFQKPISALESLIQRQRAQ